MVQIIKILFVIFVTVITCSHSDVPQKLFLSVYYESKCPDSKSFIINQLQPTLQVLQDYVMLRLIPFGKAKSIDHGYGGFVCQHGQSECLGNIVQECTLDLMQDLPDVKKVAYIACEMETGAGANNSLLCVQESNLPVDLVQNCVSSGKGVALQLKSEFLTKLVRPKFIPTITIDGIFNQQIQDSAFVDLMGTICSFLKEIPICGTYYNNIALNHIIGNNPISHAVIPL